MLQHNKFFIYDYAFFSDIQLPTNNLQFEQQDVRCVRIRFLKTFYNGERKKIYNNLLVTAALFWSGINRSFGTGCGRGFQVTSAFRPEIELWLKEEKMKNDRAL
ncbi:hypothetical protein V5799_030301 [Amblyomma americanum]|uniref:Uncharacterized protein n=1 Tax=Amblyomma americanum TaxID=6943 RepID=A0AAQ4ENJ2_AMBAM